MFPHWGPQSCLCLAWSPPSCGRPEQQHMAAGYSDGTLRVFNVSRISMELKMHPHLAALTAIAFSADGEGPGAPRVIPWPLPGPSHTFGPGGHKVTEWLLPGPGQTIISGDKDGLVAVSQPRTGLTFRTLSDHRGAPISTIRSTSKEVKWPAGLSRGVLAEKGLGQSGAGGTHLPLPAQNGAFGLEGTDLWLAASGDQRVSIWASDWLRDCCELVDWLSFPAPILTEVRVLGAPRVASAPARPATARCAFPQASDCSPPSLAAFCPWDRTLLVCAGLGPHPEVVFYSLCLKQACARPPRPGEGRVLGHGSRCSRPCA